MSSVVRQKVGKHTYLYESVGFRNEEGKPRNKRWPIGKIDPVSGLAIYKPEYLARMAAEGRPLKIPQAPTTPTLTVQDVSGSSVRDYGAFYLFEQLARQLGLLEVLRQALPRHWKNIFNLAAYLTSTGDPLAYYVDWLASTQAYPVGAMTAKRVDEMLDSITQAEREKFYELWNSSLGEQEYLALDIPAPSSWLEPSDTAAHGYQPGQDDIPPFSFCLLMGKQSGYPVCQSAHETGFRDVTALIATINAFLPLTKDRPVTAVMDREFFSAKNVNAMLAQQPGADFLAAVPITGKFAVNLVKNESRDIDALHSNIVHNGEKLHSVTRQLKWSRDQKIYAHVYYNATKAHKAREELDANVSTLYSHAQKQPEKFASNPDYTKYLIIQRPDRESRRYTVNIREDVLRTEMETVGWQIIISNCMADAKEAFEIYRDKDAVEKAFLPLKNSLDLGRHQGQNGNSMQSRLLIGFVSLILIRGIHKVMSEKNLYARMTMKKLMLSLSKLKLLAVNKKPVLLSVTKEQRDIYRAFGIKEPS